MGCQESAKNRQNVGWGFLINEKPIHQSGRAASPIASTDCFANSMAALMSSSASPGKPSRIASKDSPAASWLKIDVTRMRVPRMTGLPLQTAGSISIRSWYNILHPPLSDYLIPCRVKIPNPSGGLFQETGGVRLGHIGATRRAGHDERHRSGAQLLFHLVEAICFSVMPRLCYQH